MTSIEDLKEKLDPQGFVKPGITIKWAGAVVEQIQFGWQTDPDAIAVANFGDGVSDDLYEGDISHLDVS